MLHRILYLLVIQLILANAIIDGIMWLNFVPSTYKMEASNCESAGNSIYYFGRGKICCGSHILVFPGWSCITREPVPAKVENA